MNGTPNLKWLKCRLWSLEEEEDLDEQPEDIPGVTDENQFRKWCLL